MATTDSQEAATKQFGCAFAKAASSSTSNVDDNGDMEAGVYEAQEEDLPLKEITQCDEDDLTRTCIRDLAVGDKKLPRLPPPPSTHASRHRSSSDLCSARLGAALRFKPDHEITFAAKISSTPTPEQ